MNTRLKDYVRYIRHIGIHKIRKKIPHPKSITEALNGPYRKQWKEALQTEYKALIANGTWKLVKRSPGSITLGCHWLMSVKYHADHTIERFKARLVALGNHQKYGLDYDEIFSPVARYESLRLLLAISTIMDYHIHQMDVSTAFLHGELDEEIYMRQPEGCVPTGYENYVCKLLKSLYGLKQAPRIWYGVLHNFLTSIGFSRCMKEYCMYLKRWEVNGIIDVVIICVYVDDLTIAGSSLTAIVNVKKSLSDRFKMTDLGELNYMLKMEIKRDRKHKMHIVSQQKYIQDTLSKYGMTNCESVPTPQAKTVVLEKETKMTPQEITAQSFDYRGLVGSLMYLVRGTRPDIANAVRELSKFLSCYNETHWKAARRVLQYLKGTSMYGIVYDGTQKEVTYELYTDASFANANEGRASITGYISILADACISWRSCKQNNISLHTAEAELVAVSEGIRESQWLYMLLEELGIKQQAPIKLWCDNTAAISMVKNPENHAGSKHIETRFMYAREVYERKKDRYQSLSDRRHGS
jgi:hypothetical protein